MKKLKGLSETLPGNYSREYNEILEYYSSINFDKLDKASESMNKMNFEDEAVNMKSGYENMANINLSFAEQALKSDNDALKSYESLLFSGRDDSEY